MFAPDHVNQPRGPRRRRSGQGRLALRACLPGVPFALAFALVVALLPGGAPRALPGVSGAAQASTASTASTADASPQPAAVQWDPSTAAELQDESGCYAQLDGSIVTPSAGDARAVSQEISQDMAWSPGEGGTEVKTVVVYGNTVNGSDVSISVDGWYTDDCSGPTNDRAPVPAVPPAPASPASPASGTSGGAAASAEASAASAAAFRVAGGGAGAAAGDGLTKAALTAVTKALARSGLVPNWVKAGLAALAAAAAYVAVTAAAGAAIVALFPEIAAGTASAAVVAGAAALAGCVGGVVANGVSLLMSGSQGWKANLASSARGCVTGAAVAVLPVTRLGQAITASLRGFFGGTAAAQVAELAGQGLTVAATQAGETPLAQAIPAVFTQAEDGIDPAPAAGDANCPQAGPCEQVIQASDGYTYYCENYGGGRGYVVQADANGTVTSTLQVQATADSIVITQPQRGRQLAGQDPGKTGIFSGAGTSGDVPVNTFNVNGSGYIEYAADSSRMLGARIRVQVIGGDGVTYSSDFYNRQDPRLQTPIKDFLQGAAALNTATTQLRTLYGNIAGVSALGLMAMITGVTSKIYTEGNTITATAALAAVGVTAISQLYNAWRAVDTARNNLINAYNNLAVIAGDNPRPIPLVAFGAINARSVGQNPFHSFHFNFD